MLFRYSDFLYLEQSSSLGTFSWGFGVSDRMIVLINVGYYIKFLFFYHISDTFYLDSINKHFKSANKKCKQGNESKI